MKRKYVIYAGVLLLLIFIPIFINYFGKYVSSEDAEFNITYRVVYEEATDASGLDYLNYSVTIDNLTDKPLYRFDVNLNLNDEMVRFTPTAEIFTKPINQLASKHNPSENNGTITYSRKAVILKSSLLKEEDWGLLDSIYATMNLHISWAGGEKRFVLDKEDLQPGSTMSLLE